MITIRQTILATLSFTLFTVAVNAQTVESLYVNASTSTETITSETNSHGAPDGLEASISGRFVHNSDTWTFDFDSTLNAGAAVTAAEIYVTHRQSGYSNDSLVLEYFDGTSFIPFESFANVPTTLATVGPFTASAITSAAQLNGFQVRMRGVSKIGGSDDITYSVDDVELRATFETNDPPILSAIGSKSVTQGQLLSFTTIATDPNATIPTMTVVNLPSGASYIDNADGTGNFSWTPSFTQSGGYIVTFIASDGLLADSEAVTITVNIVGNSPPILAAIGAKNVVKGVNLNFSVSATDLESTPVVTTSTLPSGSTFTPSAGGGTFDWTPTFNQSGLYNVTFYATDDFAAVDSEVVSITVIACCILAGDANHDGSLDILDALFFIYFVFYDGSAPACFEEFDINGDCSLDISDLFEFLQFVFRDGAAPVDCHDCSNP